MVEVSSTWYRISAKAIILNDKGEFLMCKEDNGKWDLPGGGLDWGEHPIDGIKRELQEEMGLEATSISDRPLYFVAIEKPTSKRKPWISNICYETKVSSLDFTPSDECVEIGFFNTETIKEIDVFVNVTAVVEEMRRQQN